MRLIFLALALLRVSFAFAGEPPAEPVLRVEAGVHTAIINKIAVTRDGHLLTVSDDKTARLWPLAGGEPGEPIVLRVPIGTGNEGALYAAAASPVQDTAVIAGRTGISWDEKQEVVLYAFDLATSKMTGRLGELPGTVHALTYSGDGRYLAIGTSGGLRIWDRSSKALFKTTDDRPYLGIVTAAEFLPDGRLVTASMDGKVRLYDTTFQLAATHSLTDGARPWRIAVAPQGDRIAVGALDAPHIEVLSSDSLKLLKRLSGEAGRRGALSAVAWAGNTLFAAGTYEETQEDKTGKKRVRAFDLSNGKEREAVISKDAVTDLATLPDGRIAFATAEPSLGILDPRTLSASRRGRVSPDFRDAFEGTFAVAIDGTVVDFGMEQGGRAPMRFDFADRTLTRNPKPRRDMAKPSIPKGVQGWRNEPTPKVKGIDVRLDDDEYSRSVAGTPDGAMVLLGSDYGLWLFREGTLAWKVGLHAPAWAVNLTGDGRHALAALGDGTLRWYSTSNGAEVLALFTTLDERWIAWTPEGYFDHSPGAEGLVGYHINQGKAASPRFVQSGQLHQKFYRPDLVALKLRGTDLSMQMAQTGDAKTTVTKHVAPELELLAWCVRGQCNDLDTETRGNGDRAITVDAPEVTLRLKVVDQGSGAGKVVLRRNAAAVATRSATVKAEGPMQVEEQTVALEPGDNLVTITAYDQDQTVEVGKPLQLVICYTAAAEGAPTLHILSVGINRYGSAEISELSNAVNDAKGIADLMTQARPGLFREARVSLLVEQQATLSNIQQAFRRVASEARPNDVVLVFLAGHGVAIDGRYHFLPYDVAGLAPQAIKTTGLTQTALADLLSQLPTARATILIDTCYAGAFAVPDAVLRQSQDRTWAGSLAFNTGRFILAGTTNEQEALDGIGGHGIFTAVVLDALKGRADVEAKGNKDGRVDVVELSRYTEQRVPEEARKIAPTHAQRATGFFAGSDFFDLSAVTAQP